MTHFSQKFQTDRLMAGPLPHVEKTTEMFLFSLLRVPSTKLKPDVLELLTSPPHGTL